MYNDRLFCCRKQNSLGTIALRLAAAAGLSGAVLMCSTVSHSSQSAAGLGQTGIVRLHSLQHALSLVEASNLPDVKEIVFQPVEVDGDAGIYRLVDAAKPAFVLNIQGGDPVFGNIPDDWWSGQWLLKQETDGVRLVSRWKPAIALGMNGDGRVMPVSSLSRDAIWQYGISATETPQSEENDRDISIPVEPATAPVAEPSKPAEVEPATPAPQPIVTAELSQVWAADRKEDRLVNPAVKRPAQPDAPKKRTSSENKSYDKAKQAAKEMPVPTQRPVNDNSKPATKTTGEEQSSHSKNLLERIRGEFVANTNATEEVGPFHAFQKLYITDLFGPGDVFWIMADTFSFGEELLAFRGGFQSPVDREKNLYVRYALNYSELDPFPVDNDFQRLEITEHEHRFELYKVKAGEGFYSETGFFVNYLDSNQTKLELGETVPRDLSFVSTDIGLFTTGNRNWETDDALGRLHYYLSVSKGVSLFGASGSFAVRDEAESLPLVVLGRADIRHQWKESGTYWHLRAGFHYADRVTEWHKHFAIGGENYVRGFKAAEAAGEIGAAASIQIGREHDKTLALFGKPVEITWTPYVEAGVAVTESLYDDPGAELEYARDMLAGSASIGMKTKVKNWEIDVSYGVPVFGESRFDGGNKGRIALSARYSW